MTDESTLCEYILCTSLGKGQAAWTSIKAEEVVVEQRVVKFKVAGKTIAEAPGRHVVLWVEAKYRC